MDGYLHLYLVHEITLTNIMAKKTDAQIVAELKIQQKDLSDIILKIEHKQLLKIGRSAKNYGLVEWHEDSLYNAFKFLKESGESEFKTK
tara:strand:+ start:155 stop:421 length:267 start_codon:yes stop_codon:yes gene_type:complete